MIPLKKVKKVLFVFLAAVLLAAVAEATPQRVSAGFSTSPGPGHGSGPTAGITDGTSNTIVTPGGSLPSRKAGGGQQESIVILPPPHAPPFVPVPYPVFGVR